MCLALRFVVLLEETKTREPAAVVLYKPFPTVELRRRDQAESCAPPNGQQVAQLLAVNKSSRTSVFHHVLPSTSWWPLVHHVFHALGTIRFHLVAMPLIADQGMSTRLVDNPVITSTLELLCNLEHAISSHSSKPDVGALKQEILRCLPFGTPTRTPGLTAAWPVRARTTPKLWIEEHVSARLFDQSFPGERIVDCWAVRKIVVWCSSNERQGMEIALKLMTTVSDEGKLSVTAGSSNEDCVVVMTDDVNLVTVMVHMPPTATIQVASLSSPRFAHFSESKDGVQKKASQCRPVHATYRARQGGGKEGSVQIMLRIKIDTSLVSKINHLRAILPFQGDDEGELHITCGVVTKNKWDLGTSLVAETAQLTGVVHGLSDPQAVVDGCVNMDFDLVLTNAVSGVRIAEARPAGMRQLEDIHDCVVKTASYEAWNEQGPLPWVE
jgi:hypothetical protein